MENNLTPRQELINLLTAAEQKDSLEDVQKITATYFEEKKGGDKPKVWKSLIGRKVLAVTAVLTVVSIVLAALKINDIVDVTLYSTWVIIPPAWFLFEYTILFDDELKLDPVQFADLKYTQELAGKVWAAVVVLITAILYFKHTIGFAIK